MNESTREQLDVDLTDPEVAPPVEKLRLATSPAAEATPVAPSGKPEGENCCEDCCFADGE